MSGAFPHVVKLPLDITAIRKLSKGHGHRISHAMLMAGGSTEVHLTKVQYRKIGKAQQSGKGVNLRFTLPQINHHLQYGTGLWDSIKNVVGKAVEFGKKVYAVAKPAYEIYKTIKGGELEVHKPRVRKPRLGLAIARENNQSGGSSIGFQQTGGKLKVHKPRGKRQAGGGFFDSFISGVRKAIGMVTNVTRFIPGPIGTVSRVVNIANNLIPGGSIRVGRSKSPITLAEMRTLHGGRIFASKDEAKRIGYEDALKVLNSKVTKAI